jgi:trans-AT polyketide synthase/acyltransferase/oxidoreductase domain-containing protein
MNKPIIFMFSGQGSHYFKMGLEMFNQHQTFKKWMRDLNEIASDMVGESVLNKIYGKKQSTSDLFDRTLYTHPAIFMVKYALTQALLEDGIEPDYLLGTSMGSFAAAAVAGILPVEEVLKAVVKQAQVLETHCQKGGMTAIVHNPTLFHETPLLFNNSELASVNFHSHFVVSGKPESLTEIGQFLSQKNIIYQSLPVSIGFHSTLIEPAASIYTDFLNSKTFRAPKIPLICCVSADIISSFAPNYLWEVVRKPILFQQTVQALENKQASIYLDLGPSGTLANFVKYNLTKQTQSKSFPILTAFGGQSFKNLETVKDFLAIIPSDRYQANRKTSTNRLANATERRKQKMITWVFPGQGSQEKGMGATLFDEFADLTAQADEILGYSIKTLCLENPNRQLNQTQYTQPALYVVNALTYFKKLKEANKQPDFVAGHSLGEYNALLAAGGVDFATGLKLVQKRGQLMSQASGGGMAAVINCPNDKLKAILTENGLTGIDIANYNSPSQIVIAGHKDDINRVYEIFELMEEIRCVVLNVSAAFHSRYMRDAQQEFEQFLNRFEFAELKIPIISNVTARPYQQTEIAANLAKQMTHSVNWVDSIRYLMGQREMEFEEVGPGNVLTKLVAKIQKEAEPLVVAEPKVKLASVQTPSTPTKTSPIQKQQPTTISKSVITAESLGNQTFKQDYNLKYAYVTGAMVKGIASKELVVKIGKAGMMGFFGTGGLKLPQIEEAIRFIQTELKEGQAYGINFLHNSGEPQQEEKTIDLFMKLGVKQIDAAAFMQITPALVKYRLKGFKRDRNGNILATHKLMAKISRPEVAQVFLSPAPERLVNKLLEANQISTEQAQLAKEMPMADDLCVEADSGGHTDMGIMPVLLPTIIRQRDELMAQYRYAKPVRVGAAGGIGTPESAATAFILGADFIMTGSINQCTVEAGTSDAVKDILQQLNVQDTDYAPAGDMFELGAKVQVVRKGVFFPARANKLYDLYRHYNSLDEIDDKTKKQIQDKYFRRSFDEVYAETKAYYSSKAMPEEIEKAERNPKHKMALIFKWYFVHSGRLAMQGSTEQKVDYQIHCGPAMGAFNQWVKGTALENWRNRHVDEIAEKLMHGTAELLNQRFKMLNGA